MGKLIKIIGTFSCLLLSTVVFGQGGTEQIELANKVLTAANSCDSALKHLMLAPIGVRQSPEYLVCMGRVQDCKQNYEQALYYYNKYVALRPQDDSVVRRIAELADQKSKLARQNIETSTANAVYHGSAKHEKRKRHRRRKVLDNDYYSHGVSIGLGTSSKNSPYRGRLATDHSTGRLIFNDQAVLDINFSLGISVIPNEGWFKRTFEPYAKVDQGPFGSPFTGIMSVGMSAVLVNNKRVALTLGPILGGQYYSHRTSWVREPQINIVNKVSFCYGFKSNLFVGNNVMFFLSGIFNSANTVTVLSNLYPTMQLPANYNTINFGIAARIDPWW